MKKKMKKKKDWITKAKKRNVKKKDGGIVDLISVDTGGRLGKGCGENRKRERGW